jgi:hypothetical protein
VVVVLVVLSAVVVAVVLVVEVPVELVRIDVVVVVVAEGSTHWMGTSMSTVSLSMVWLENRLHRASNTVPRRLRSGSSQRPGSMPSTVTWP